MWVPHSIRAPSLCRSLQTLVRPHPYSGHTKPWQALAGLDILRKICNHPDLLERGTQQGRADYGDPCRSGKLQVCARAVWGVGAIIAGTRACCARCRLTLAGLRSMPLVCVTPTSR